MDVEGINVKCMDAGGMGVEDMDVEGMCIVCDISYSVIMLSWESCFSPFLVQLGLH